METCKEVSIKYYDTNGNEQIRCVAPVNSDALVHLELMQSHYCKISFTSKTPVYIELGDFVETAFGRFEVIDTVNPKESDSIGYSFEIQFDAYYRKWKNKTLKYRPNTGSAEANFSLTNNIGTHAEIILDNLKFYAKQNKSFLYDPKYTGEGTDFVVSVDDSVDKVAAKLITYSSSSILDAIANIAETFDCEWWLEGNIIHFGTCENLNEIVDFKCGDNIVSMANSQSQSTYSNRVYAFGAARNLPSDYKEDASADVTKYGVVEKRLMLPTGSECSDENKTLLETNGFELQSGCIQVKGLTEDQYVEGVTTNDDIYPRNLIKTSKIASYERTVEDESTTDEDDYITRTFYRVNDLTIVDDDGEKTGDMAFRSSYKLSGKTLHILFQSGSLNGMDFECEFNPDAETEILRDANGNAILRDGKEQINPASQVFEIVGNEDYGRFLPDTDLHPKEGDTFVLYNWDATKLGNTLVTSSSNELLTDAIKDLKKSMIDPTTYTCTADSHYSFNNGEGLLFGLGDRVNLDNKGYSKEVRQSRIIGYEFHLDLPFDSPKYYVGEKPSYSRLNSLESQIEELVYNGKSYVNNGPGGNSVYIIKTYDKVSPTDYNVYSAKSIDTQRLNKTKADTAQGTIAFTSGLTLGSKAKYSLDKDGNAVLNVAELAGAVLKELVSQGFSQANKTGFWMTDADESGHSYLEIDKLYVRMKAIFDELEIRKRSYVGGNVIYSCAASKFTDVVWWTAETNAGGTETSDITGIAAFKCYIKTDDGTTETENWWKVNDLAICQTFNVNENSTVRNAQNKFYWRKVTDVGSETVTYEDGSQEVRGYIMLSNTTKGVGYADSGVDHTNDAALYGSAKVVTTGTETVVTDGDILTTGTSSAGVPSDFPEAEDSVTQLGNTDSTQGRGNALEIMVYTPSQGGTSILEGATCEAPALVQYHGITGFTLANKAKVVISPSGNTFKAKSFVIETGETSVRVPLDLGEWTKGTFYAYYSRVSHNGQLWLLDKIAENATTAEEPTDGCTYWTLQVAKGEDGDGLSVKGTVKGHWTNYTAWMADKNKPTLTEGDKVALDSSSDIPTSICPSGVAKPTIVEYVNAPDYTYTATAANEGDGYMDGDGILWVAGATAWTNAGKIKGDKGDKGDDAEWYEIVARSATSGQQVQSIALDADGNPKTSVRLVLTRHIGSASTAITPSEVEMAASEGSLSEDSSSWVLQLSTTTSDSVTVTAKYLGKTYAVTLPCVRDGKQGDPGEATDGISALALSFSPSSLVFDTDDDGTLTGSQSGTLAVARGGVDYTYNKEYTCAVSAVENLVLSDMQSILSVSSGKPVVTVNSGDIKTYDTGLTDANGNKLVFPYTEGFVDIIVTTLKTPIETQHIRLSWHVNYAKYVGRQTVTQKEFKSEYEEYTAANDKELKRVESSISQTAREISLSVSEQAIGRRNMLFGTALLSEEDLRVIHQPESSSVMTVLGGYGGTNALKGKVDYGGGFRWWGGSVGNIKIEKGKTYTFSCWVKTDHACTLDFELAYESSPSDTSRPAGGVFSVIGETITTLNEWQLVKGTYTMGQDYEYVEVFVFFTNHSGSGTHCICRPMMEEGDTYNGWTLSEDDADYIGGNMLDGTRSLTLGGNLTVLTGDVTDNGFGDSSAITADASSEEKDMLQWTVADSVAKGADYIFSFWAKGTGNVTAFLYPTTGDNTYTEASDGSSAWYSDGRASLALTSEWRRYWVHWSMKSDSLAQYCLLRASGGSVSIAQPKLERGGKATDYTERSTDLVSKTQLKKKTGIDIESGIVTVTADNFVVQNNEGTRTALISADGTLNASLVQASKLETLGSTGSARVSIENGLISVFGAAGLCNIKFGVNDDGMAVLSYYNDDGVHLYDLGPNGFDDSMTTKAKVTEAMLGDILGTLGASQISDIASTGVLSLDGLWEVRKAYRQGLFGAGIDSDYSTPAGYAPTVSSSIKGKQYSCGYTEKTPTPDKERGLTTSALAKAADGLWFTGTPFAKDGALCNLLSGTYLKGTEKVRLSPKSDTLTDDIYCITLSVFTDGKEATATIYARYGKKV